MPRALSGYALSGGPLNISLLAPNRTPRQSSNVCGRSCDRGIGTALSGGRNPQFHPELQALSERGPRISLPRVHKGRLRSERENGRGNLPWNQETNGLTRIGGN